MPQISPISWSIVLILLIILIASTSTQITYLSTKPLPNKPITTKKKPTKW